MDRGRAPNGIGHLIILLHFVGENGNFFCEYIANFSRFWVGPLLISAETWPVGGWPGGLLQETASNHMHGLSVASSLTSITNTMTVIGWIHKKKNLSLKFAINQTFKCIQFRVTWWPKFIKFTTHFFHTNQQMSGQVRLIQHNPARIVLHTVPRKRSDTRRDQGVSLMGYLVKRNFGFPPEITYPVTIKQCFPATLTSQPFTPVVVYFIFFSLFWPITRNTLS